MFLYMAYQISYIRILPQLPNTSQVYCTTLAQIAKKSIGVSFSLHASTKYIPILKVHISWYVWNVTHKTHKLKQKKLKK